MADVNSEQQAPGIDLFDATFQDLRFGLRTLRRSPAFTITALLTLALTMGAVSTVLSLANAIAYRPIAAYRPPDLVVVAAVRKNPVSWERVSYADYAQVRDHTTTLRDLAAHGSGGLFFFTHDGFTKKLSVAIVSAGFFPLFGVKPALGRFFGRDEDHVPGRDSVAVLSHHLWRQEFNTSPAALGAVVKVNGVPFTVIGVAPEAFHGVDPRPSELYIPTMMLGAIRGIACDAIADPDCSPVLQMIGRLRDGQSLDSAKAEVAMLTPGHWRENPRNKESAKTLAAFRPRGAWGTYGDFGFDAFPEGGPLFIVAGLCFLLGCANLGGLQFARGSRRMRELAIRASLGPTPLRILRQLMTESILLAVCGGALGIILSVWLTHILGAIFYHNDATGQPNHFDLRPDAFVIGCAASISVVAGFLFGLLPALKAVRLGSALTLTRQASSFAAQPRLTRWLIGAQVAVALALVTLAALLWSSARRFTTDGHFDPRHVALLRVEPDYPPERTKEFLHAVVRQLDGLPGILAVSVFDAGLVLDGESVTVSRSEDPVVGRRVVQAAKKDVGPRYFDVLGTPLIRGRDFEPRDSLYSPAVAIVDESLGHALWPDGDPVGSTLVVENGPPMTVVGMVRDVSAARGGPRTSHLYVPFWQVTDAVSARYCVRVQGDPSAALPMLVRTVNSIDPQVPITETMPMATQLAAIEELKAVRMTAAIAAYAAALAVVLATIGIYGTVAFSVVRRTKEIGVRISMGAGPRDIIGLIVKEEMMIVSAGALVGIALAWGASRFLHHLLYGTDTGASLLYAGVALLIVAVGFVACWIPARRATHLDPMTALKAE